MFGNIFSDTVDMGDKSSHIRTEYKRSQSGGNVIQGGRNSSIPNNLYALFKQAKKEMATVKIGWFLFNFLGWPTAIITFLSAIFGDVVLGDIGEPYKSIVIVLGIFFLIVKILISYEHWREKHINNSEREWELWKKKNTPIKQNTNKH